MLSKFLQVPSWKICRFLHLNNESFVKVKSVPRKKITNDHIESSNSISELFQNIDIVKSSNQQEFRKLMSKFTQLLLQQKNKKKDKETLQQIHKFLYKIRKYSSIQINSNASQLLNYQLMFKQLCQLFSGTYYKKGMEIRITVFCQNMPISTSFQFRDSVAMSLLHYMSCLSLCSQNGLKKQLFHYFYRQNITYQKNKIMNIHQKKSQKTETSSNGSPTPPSTSSTGLYNPINNLILLNSNQRYETITSPHSYITQIAFINLNKNIKYCLIYLKATKIIKIYDTILQKRENQLRSRFYQLSQQMKDEIRREMLLNQFIKKLNQGHKELVLNCEEKFLHLVNFLVSTLGADYKQFYNSQVNEKPAYQLMKYFYSIFLFSQNMKIQLSTIREDITKSSSSQASEQPQSQTQLQQISPAEKTIETTPTPPPSASSSSSPLQQKGSVKQVYLFKIAYHILQASIKNKIYLHQRDKLERVIVFKVLAFVDQLVQVPGGQGKGEGEDVGSIGKHTLQELEKYFDAIIKTLKILPLQPMQQYQKSHPKIHKKLYLLLSQIISHTASLSQSLSQSLPNPSSISTPQLQTLKASFLELLEYKKSLFLSKKQILQLLQIFIYNNPNYDDFDIYFLMASTNDQIFVKAIPIEKVLATLAKQRDEMRKFNRYINPLSFQSKTDQKLHHQKLQQIRESRNWDAKLLQLYALCIHLNKNEKEIEQLLNKNKYSHQIKISEIKYLFDTWFTPLTDIKINMLKKTKNTQEEMEQKSIQVEEEYLNMKIEAFQRFIPCYINLFHYLFVQTKCLTQFRLIQKILIQNKNRFLSIAKNLQKKERNFNFCFITVALGLADEKNKSKYLQMYSLKNMQIDTFNRHQIFKTIHNELLQKFTTIQQWQYFISFYTNFTAFEQIRSLFTTYLPLNYTYLSSVVNKINPSIEHPLCDTYTYDDKNVPKYSNQFKIKIENALVRNQIIQLSSFISTSKHQKPIQRKISSLSLHLYQLFCERSLNLTIQKHLIDEFDRILNKAIFPNTAFHSKHIFIFGALGMLGQENLRKLLSRINDSRKINALRFVCVRLLGKQKCLELGLVKQEYLEGVDADLFKIWSQNQHSLMWILTVYQFCSIENRLQAFIYMYKNLINPTSRRIAYEHLLKRLKKQKISSQNIKFQPYYDEYSVTGSAGLNFNSSEQQIHEQHLELQTINFHKSLEEGGAEGTEGTEGAEGTVGIEETEGDTFEESSDRDSEEVQDIGRGQEGFVEGEQKGVKVRDNNKGNYQKAKNIIFNKKNEELRKQDQPLVKKKGIFGNKVKKQETISTEDKAKNPQK